MVKYCPACGKESDDLAVFCTGCGQKFPDQSGASLQPISSPIAQVASNFTAERGTGAHAHVDTDIFLKDSSGKLVLAARKQSLVHNNYDIVDGSGASAGFIEAKTHLTHRSLCLLDENHKMLWSVSVTSIHSRGVLPNCWLEDADGNRKGSVTFTNGLLGFSFESNGNTALEASIETGGTGIVQELSSLGHRRYAINLVDAAFQPTLLLTVLVAIYTYVTY